MYEVILLCNKDESTCPIFTFEFQEDVDLFVKYCLVNYFSVKINYKKTDKDNTSFMENNWINVQDILPNMNQLVLAYHNFKDKFCDDQHIIITRFEYQDYWTDGTITHWMPLPKPPIN